MELSPYAQALLDASSVAVPVWLERCVVDTSRKNTGVCPPELLAAARTMASAVAPTVIGQLRRLLATDVDEQRTNPLSVLRSAVAHPTEVLLAAGVPHSRRDRFAIDTFPDDVYGLSPATWADVDPAMQEAGLIWGAWKAKTVLDRRRTSPAAAERSAEGVAEEAAEM